MRTPGNPKAPERPDIRPLSRGATRLFVITAVVLAFAVAIAATLYLLDVAQDALPVEPTKEEAAPPPFDS